MVVFRDDITKIKAHKCVILRSGGSSEDGYIAQKYTGDLVDDLIEFTSVDIEDFFDESISKIRKLVGPEITIFCVK